MSIVTKTGDAGVTGLMYNRRLSKAHPRVEAYGCVDELNASLGLARATADHEATREQLMRVQQDMVILMGELATAVEDKERYVRDGYPVLGAESLEKLEAWIREIEAQNVSFRGWATPGYNLPAAALDMARTVCRRAERRVCELHDCEPLQNPHLLIYLNRLSDWLWLLARWAESRPAAG